jgi:hypothetical protein
MVTSRPGRGGQSRRRGGAAARSIGVAVVLGALLAVAPPSVHAVAAATAATLLESATQTYTLDPSGAVHVVAVIKATNNKPDTGGFFYFYDQIGQTIQPEAQGLEVSDPNGPLHFKTKLFGPEKKILAREEVTVTLRHRLLYSQSVTLTFRFDLGSDPRSRVAARANGALAVFAVYAFGDGGHSKTTVILPAGYIADVTYESLTKTTSNGVTKLTDQPADVPTAWSIVTARRVAGYVTASLSLGGGISLAIESYPGDEAWATAVHDTLDEHLPDMQALTGLPWSASTPVEIRETYIHPFNTVPHFPVPAGLLPHYGVVSAANPTAIDLPESTDPFEILAQTSSYWFNSNLFLDRWIDVGFAREYAAEALIASGMPEDAPGTPTSADVSTYHIGTWADSVELPDDVVAAAKAAATRETTRTEIAWYVVHQLYQEIGPEKMRAVLAAAGSREDPYRGDGASEAIQGTPSWERFLDLLEEIGGSTRAEDVLKTAVLTPNQATTLAERAAARTAYATLVANGRGWLPSAYIRAQMASWRFKDAEKRIGEAQAVLDLRAKVEAAASALGLSPGAALQTAYERADNGFDAAMQEGQAELTALAALASAHVAVSATPDLVTTIGLVGAAAPRDAYDAAAAAYQRGDLKAATDGATATQATLTAAAAAGPQRILIGAGGAVGLMVLVALALVLRRRRRRGPAEAVAVAVGPETNGPWGTLAPDPTVRPEASPPLETVEPEASLPPLRPPGEGGEAVLDEPAESS